MRGKREKTNRMNKAKAILIIVCICMIIGIIVLLITDKKNEIQDNEKNNTNTTNSVANIDENSSEPQIIAHIVKTKQDEIITDGAKFDSNIIVYCNGGNIESITNNNSKIQKIEINQEGTELKEDGIYKIIMKPNNESQNIIATITLDTVIPILQIGDRDISGMGMVHKLGKKVTLKEGKGKNKFTKALLIKCNSNEEIIKTEEPTDITQDLKSDGYVLNEEGIYKIQLLDENNNQIEFIGKDSTFKIR